MVTDGPLTLDVAIPEDESVEPADPADEGPGPGLRVHLSTMDGVPVRVEYPELAQGRHTIEAVVEGCAPRCRRRSVRPAARSRADLRAGTSVANW